MYARSNYIDEQNRPILPENYDGTAFMERSTMIIDEPSSSTEEKTVEASSRSEGILSTIGRLPIFSGLFNASGKTGNMGFLNLGTEEILILTTAAFIFFSKNGDKESALILLLLLFIN